MSVNLRLEESLVREMRSQLRWREEMAPANPRRARVGQSSARMWLNGHEADETAAEPQRSELHHLSDIYD
jgi:hypothetical protein